MVKDNTLTPSNFEPYEFDDATLLEIGRLVRAFSDLEDALTTFIFT